MESIFAGLNYHANVSVKYYADAKEILLSNYDINGLHDLVNSFVMSA